MSYPVWRPGWRAPYRRNWDPFGDLAALRAEMARMMSGQFGGRAEGDWFGDVDVDENEDGWTVTARLPGVAPEEVAVEVEDRDLCIRAKTETEHKDENDATARRAAFNYRLSLPSDADADRVDATMDHGLLTIRLPRSAQSRRREITIGRGDR
jgi:HSP20 family protein